MRVLIALLTGTALAACHMKDQPTHMLLEAKSSVQIEVHNHCMKVTNLTDQVVGFIPMDEENWTNWGMGIRKLEDGTPSIKTEVCK